MHPRLCVPDFGQVCVYRFDNSGRWDETVYSEIYLERLLRVSSGNYSANQADFCFWPLAAICGRPWTNGQKTDLRCLTRSQFISYLSQQYCNNKYKQRGRQFQQSTGCIHAARYTETDETSDPFEESDYDTKRGNYEYCPRKVSVNKLKIHHSSPYWAGRMHRQYRLRESLLALSPAFLGRRQIVYLIQHVGSFIAYTGEST